MSSNNQFKIKKIGRSSILYDDSIIGEPDLQLFGGVSRDGDYHTKADAQQNISADSTTSASRAGVGRAPVVYVQHEGQPLVLKHYYRGGLVARLSRDCYLGLGVEGSRAFKEFRLLKAMRELGLPVPDAVAARVEKGVLCYRADLVTREIEQVTTLADMLCQRELDEALWKKIGYTIKQFHQHDIYHADLNARNILLDEAGEIYLIDFDNSAMRSGSASWQAANLSRLHRSLMKFKNRHTGFNFSDSDWSVLLDGYKH